MPLTVEMTSTAEHQLQRVQARHPGQPLRIAVEQLCECGKMGFHLSWEDAIKPDDAVFHQSGLTIITDPANFPYVDGAKIDFSDDIMEKKFIIRHPRVETECQGQGRS